MYIIFDTETTGLPKRYNAPVTDFNNWPRMVQLAWQVYDSDGSLVEQFNYIIKPKDFFIPREAEAIHRISQRRAEKEGVPLKVALEAFAESVKKSQFLIAHNISFDEKILGCEFLRMSMRNCVQDISHVCTKNTTVDFCKLPKKRGKGYKWPTQMELYEKLFNERFKDAHDALADVTALARIFFELQKIGVLGFKGDGSNVMDYLKDYPEHQQNKSHSLVHYGIHTYHSILESAGSEKDYIKLAKENGHSSMALCDSSTLSGTFNFFVQCEKNGIKPIMGADFHLNDNIGLFDDVSEEGDSYRQKVFVKDEVGYKNINKLLYLANTVGFNSIGRITTEWLIENSEGLFITTSTEDSYMGSLIRKGKEVKAEEYFEKLFKIFGRRMIAEIQLVNSSTQKNYNNFIIKQALKRGLLIIVTNDTYYPKKEDSRLRDVIISIKKKMPLEKCSLPENRAQFYFGSEEFYTLNKLNGYDYPEGFIKECLDNTVKFASACNYKLEFGVEKYPKYEPTEDIIEYFNSTETVDIIVKLAFSKLKQKIGIYKKNGIVDMTEEKIKEYVDRLNYEISIIESKKMLDYFLVNWEIIRDYRSRGYEIGPARGSAAGSLLSWCLDITKIDPIRFNLYFERFLNPERDSPPDIDIDFMNGTDWVVDEFLINKYGRERVMPVCTFQTFNEKGCLKDVVRAIQGNDATSNESDVAFITKRIMPNFDKYDGTLKDWFEEYPAKNNANDTAKSWINNAENKEVIELTIKLQGQIRGIGQHAAGMVITPGPSWDYLPINVIAKSQTMVSAFQEADKSGKDLSTLGILKLDILKLTTLNVIDESIKLIKKVKGEDVTDAVNFVDLYDKNLFQELRMGLNHGVFQFESAGMNALIRGMQVDSFQELVAANALYRPGPMGIGAHSEFIKNKFNPSGIKYVHPALEPILSETNGVLVFQEQLMFIADKIGGMGLGRGDMLRRFMDKASKIIAKNSAFQVLTDEEKTDKNWLGFSEYWNEFLEGAANQGYNKDEVDKIKDWVIKYLGYSFNKSHSLSYSYLAMQTLYLKHYHPTEFYTSLLNHPKTSGSKEEQRAWMAAAIASAMSKGIKIKTPNRKSRWNWTVTGDNEITMGFSGISGVGDIAYKELIDFLKPLGKPFENVSMIEFFDLPFSKFNKSAFESCVKAGMFDDWSSSREFLFSMKGKKRKKQPANQFALFDLGSEEFDIRVDSSEYPPTQEDKKILEFEEVCNFNLSEIERITTIKEEMNAKARKKGNTIESIMNYTEKGWYFFVVDYYKIDKTKAGKDYLTLTVGDGISKMKIRAFGGLVEKFMPILERGAFYVASFTKNDKGFLNFNNKTKIKRYEAS